jgi:hypothetical protein
MHRSSLRAMPPASDLADETTDLIDALIRGWQATFAAADRQLTFGQRNERPHVGRFATIYGLAAHAHVLVEQARPHLTTDLLPAVLPLVRQAYECGLTAAWAALNRESAFAQFNEEIRRTKAVRVTLGKSRQFAGRLELLPDEPDEMEGVSSVAQARNFAALCEDLEPDGATLYLLYRILSKYCHAGPFVIDQYLTPTEADPGIPALHVRPERPGMEPELTAFLAAAALVVAGRAVDFIDPARTRRSELRRAARELGIPAELRLSARAQQRIDEAEKVRRQASRKRRQ